MGLEKIMSTESEWEEHTKQSQKELFDKKNKEGTSKDAGHTSHISAFPFIES